MKKKIIILLGTMVMLVIIGIVAVNLLSKNNKKEEVKENTDEYYWGNVAEKYHYVPNILQVEIPEDFSEIEIIDISIKNDKLDKKLTEKPIFSGVYAKRNDDHLLILVPEDREIRAAISLFVSTELGYSFSVSKSNKKLGEFSVNEELMKELMKEVEFVGEDMSFDSIEINQ